MSLIQGGLPVFAAAAKTAMCLRTASKYRKAGKLPRDMAREHDWRTRPDPFEGVWAQVQALLEGAPGLQPKTIFGELQRLHPGRLPAGQLRTLQAPEFARVDGVIGTVDVAEARRAGSALGLLAEPVEGRPGEPERARLGGMMAARVGELEEPVGRHA